MELEQVLDYFPKYQMKILLGDLHAQLGREDIFKLTIGIASIHQGSHDNTVIRTVNFATSRILVVKSTIFPHQNIHKYTWTCPDGKTHKQIDYVLIDRRWHSSIQDVRIFRGADYETDHSPVITNVRERLAVSKQAARQFHVERFNVRKLSELEVKKQYQIEITDRFAALENLNESEDIKVVWENIKETIKT